MEASTLIIIPAYNEGSSITGVLGKIRSALPSVSILVVDDGSSDNTVPVASACEGVKVISHAKNCGYGSALLTGYRYAIREDYERLIQMDADGQHEVASINTVMAALDDGADLVLGNRFLAPDSYSPPWVKRMGIRVFGIMTTLITGQKIGDVTTGYQGLSRALLRFYACNGLFPRNYPDANIIIRAFRAGFRIKEVPVTMHVAADGASMHSGLRPIIYIFKMVWMIGREASRHLPQVSEMEAKAFLQQMDD